MLSLFEFCDSKKVEESYTGALLKFPSIIDSNDPLYNQEWDVAPAQFGYQKYGGTLEGYIVLPADPTYHLECTGEPYRLNGTTGPYFNPYVHEIKDWDKEGTQKYILLIDRGNCYFVDKIEHAQAIGASGVIMCDKRQERLFTMWMPEDWDDDIDIPSVLLQYNHCKALVERMGVRNWDPYGRLNTTYPNPLNPGWQVIAKLEWGLPRPDDRVEWELWTSANDEVGTQFKHNFKNVSEMLDAANDTLFTPHFYTLNGSHWGCDQSYLPCVKQCSNSGRYCAVDPEYDLTIGLDGIDVVQENLRQICVWEYDKKWGKANNNVLWWDYTTLWDDNCFLTPKPELTFTENCSFTQMDKIHPIAPVGQLTLKEFVKKCVNESGGYGYHAGKNTLLDGETRLRENSSIYALPMVRVNEFLIHGNIDCEFLTVEQCEVLSAICAGFINGTKPAICFATPAPTPGTCDGSDPLWRIDECGLCLSVDDPYFNKECAGCDGIPNSGWKFNDCHACMAANASDFDTYLKDCALQCNGVHRIDRCGQCLLRSDPKWESCVGCDGIPFSGYVYNDCHKCMSPNASDFNTFGKDCAGICNGNHQMDACNQCLLTSDSKWDNCVNPTKNNTCDGSSSYWRIDQCGNCLRIDDPNYNKACMGCDGVPNSGYKLNPCHFCMLANASDFNVKGKDCAGECNGMHKLDDCNQCLLRSDQKWDNCVGCDGTPFSGFKYNDCHKCLHFNETYFSTLGKDCAGKCYGTSKNDSCGQCLVPSDKNWNHCVGCDGVPNSGKIYNPCGVCLPSNANDFDSHGKDCAGICNGDHWKDACGQCLLINDPKWDNCIRNSTNSNNNNNNNNNQAQNNKTSKTDKELTTIIVIVCCLAFFIIIAACFIIFRLWKKQQDISDRFTSLANTYQMMDENPKHSKKINVTMQQSNDGMQTIPDNDPDSE